jgi:hypothetical protein
MSWNHRSRSVGVAAGVALALVAGRAAADMPHNDMPHNSVSLAGLRTAAPLLRALAGGKLDWPTIKAALDAHPSLADPRVPPLLAKIVSCALDGDKSLPPFPGAGGTPLQGELGLCGARSRLGDWGSSALAPAAKRKCLEAVSACVLARVNAIGHRVVISVRSRSPQLPLSLQPRVPIETQYRDKQPVKALQTCGAPPAVECGYQPAYVGRCVAGRTVKLRVSPGMQLRVCGGIYGCDTDLPVPRPTYVSVLVAHATDRARFTCPANGPRVEGRRWGYYAVMTRPPASDPAAHAKVRAQSAGGEYPAPERDVFTWPEGAFYGDLFDTDAWEKAPPTDPKGDQESPHLLAGAQFACYGRVWTDGVAQMDDRFCALPPTAPGAVGCFVNPPMACYRAGGDRCAADATGARAFASCKGEPSVAPTAPWKLPITTYLNDPCDLSADPNCDPAKVAHRSPPDPDGDGDDDEDDRAQRAQLSR